MATNDSKVYVDSRLEKLQEKYPVERIGVMNSERVTDKEVKEAVKKINPDKDSLGCRG